MNNYMKFLANLVNVDVAIEEKDKALILLILFLIEDYDTFVITLINGKQSIDYNEVSSTLANNELRRKDIESSNSTSTETLTVRGRSSYRKDKGDRERSKSRFNFRDLKRISVPSLKS